MTWRVPVVLFIERNCADEADAVEAAGLALECLPDGYGMSYVIGVPARVTGALTSQNTAAAIQKRQVRGGNDG